MPMKASESYGGNELTGQDPAKPKVKPESAAPLPLNLVADSKSKNWASRKLGRVMGILTGLERNKIRLTALPKGSALENTQDC